MAGMEIEQAKSELMQIYGMLSPDKQRAIDTLVKIEPCEDCVSREAVLDMWKKESCGNRCLYRDRCSETYCDFKLFQNKLGLLPSVNPQEPKWIPVGKESPVAFKKVLVTYRLHNDDSIHIGIGSTKSNINGRYYWKIDEQDFNEWDILAWSPLPEPYEPQESEETV